MEQDFSKKNLNILDFECDEQDELVKVYLAKSDYHIENWNRSKIRKPKMNVVPLIFGGYWLLFKGMALYGVAYVVFSVTLMFFIPEFFINIFLMVSNIVLAFTGNKLYYKFILKKVDKVMLTYTDKEQMITDLLKQRKRSVITGICIYIFCVLISALGVFFG